MKQEDPISFADAAFERRGLHDFFTPLSLSVLPQKQPISNKLNTTKKKERSRSIQFADEKQEAEFMLETILLFESDDCFGDSSVVEAVMEDFHHDSLSSFDGEDYYEYAAAQPVSSDDDDDEDDSVESAPLTWKELEQEVRVQQAREFRERNDSGSSMVLENPPNTGVFIDTNKAQGGREVHNGDIVSGNPDNKGAPRKVATPNKKKHAKTKNRSPVTSPKREVKQERKVNLQKALENSTSLRLLNENGKARKAREKERLKGQKELEEKLTREKERQKNQQKLAETKPKPVRRAPKRTKSALNRVKKEEQQEEFQPQPVMQTPEQKGQGFEEPKKPQPVRRAPKRTKSALNRLKKNDPEVSENGRRQSQQEQAQQKEPEKEEVEQKDEDRPKNPQPVRRAPKRTKSSSNRIKRTETDPVLPTHSRRASVGAQPSSKLASGSKLQRTNTDPVNGGHNGVKHNNRALKDFDFPKSSVASAAARWGKKSSSVESSSQKEVLSAQQKRMNELKVCSNFQQANEGMMSSSAQYAESAYQRRQRELGAVRRSSIVGGNLLSKRERLVVILQAAVRGYLLRTQVDRHCRFDATIQVQALWRGYSARKCIAETRAKIAAMERHLEEITRATENEVASIFNSPELQSLQDLLNDANLNARQRALEKEKLKIKNDTSCVKNDTSQIKQYMENQKVNNKNVAKSTREIEWQCSQLKERIASLQKEEQYLVSKKDQAKAKVTNMKAAISELECRAKVEHAVGKISHRTILEIRDHTKEAAQTSKDPFLTKVNTRSKILDRVRLGMKLGKAGKVRPTVKSL